jgi:hypothetical protein
MYTKKKAAHSQVIFDFKASLVRPSEPSDSRGCSIR